VPRRTYRTRHPALLTATRGAYTRGLADFCTDTNRLAGGTALRGIGMTALDADLVEQATADLGQIRELGLDGAMIAIAPSENITYGDKKFDPFWAKAQ